jgi:hypothetical protein
LSDLFFEIPEPQAKEGQLPIPAGFFDPFLIPPGIPAPQTIIQMGHQQPFPGAGQLVEKNGQKAEGIRTP